MRTDKKPLTGVEWCEALKIPITEEQRRAIRFLEAEGRDFFIHFGHQNAIATARIVWRDRAGKKRTL